MNDLDGRAVVVTGAAGNLGAVVCARLLRSGASVFALVRKESDFAALTALGGGAQLVAHACDLTDEGSVEQAYARAAERFGPLSGAAHCAGGWAGAQLSETSVADFDKLVSLNLRTTFLCTRTALRHMLPRGAGRIVNVAAWNPAVLGGLAGAGVYAATKAGVIALTKAAAEEGAAYGVRASCVAPGTLRTGLNAGPGAAGQVPLEDVAEAIVFLLSPAAGAASGAVLLLPARA